MRVIKASTIRGYMARHPSARPALAAWLVVVLRAEWSSIADVRRTYPHADAVTVGSGRTVTVFNIGGNSYRLVVAIHYDAQRVYVREFMTHAGYDKDAWKRRN